QIYNTEMGKFPRAGDSQQFLNLDLHPCFLMELAHHCIRRLFFVLKPTAGDAPLKLPTCVFEKKHSALFIEDQRRDTRVEFWVGQPCGKDMHPHGQKTPKT